MGLCIIMGYIGYGVIITRVVKACAPQKPCGKAQRRAGQTGVT